MSIVTGFPDRSLRSVVVRGLSLESLGFVVRNALRLASHLAIARILYPEAFGLMALVALALSALQLLSDFGLNACVIRSERGDDPAFLNTAWTLQAIRGLLLWLGCVASASPLAAFYEEPLLAYLIPFAGLAVLLQGLNSTSLLTARRHLRVGTIVFIDIAASLVSVAVMLSWALLTRSVWALAAGGVAGAITRLAASHHIAVRPRNRFAWDPAAAASIFQFGKWIFLSTAIYFVSQQLDRAMLSRLVGLDVLGVYSVALLLASVLSELAVRLSHGVIFPALSRARLEAVPAKPYYQVRLLLDMAFLPALGAITVLGSELVSLLYDQRYSEAGWMLELLAVRVAFSCVLAQCESCLIAMGHPRYAYVRNLARALWIAAAIPVGWSFFGISGVVWAVALSEAPGLIALWRAAHRHGLLRPVREVLSLALFLLGVALGSIIAALLPGA